MIVPFFRNLCPVCGMVVCQVFSKSVLSAMEHIEYFREHFKIIYYLIIKYRTAALKHLLIKPIFQSEI